MAAPRRQRDKSIFTLAPLDGFLCASVNDSFRQVVDWVVQLTCHHAHGRGLFLLRGLFFLRIDQGCPFECFFELFSCHGCVAAIRPVPGFSGE